MPGLRFLSLLEMQQSTFSKIEQRTCQVSGSAVTSAVRDLRKVSKRTRSASQHLTPENEPVQRSSRIALALPGSLIHLSQSADGKLRWDPPSSSITSLNEGKELPDCLSAECGRAAIVSPVLARSEQTKPDATNRDSVPSEGGKHQSFEVGPSSSSLTSYCRNRNASESSIICSAESFEDSDVQEVSFGLQQQDSSSSDLYTCSGAKNVPVGLRGSLSSRTGALSPYVSSKLKPGKHILGVKKHQNYIRPGQLRHWAVVNSPSLNLANLPATLKGKACRTLAF